jgi:hypothetical protein
MNYLICCIPIKRVAITVVKLEASLKDRPFFVWQGWGLQRKCFEAKKCSYPTTYFYKIFLPHFIKKGEQFFSQFCMDNAKEANIR